MSGNDLHRPIRVLRVSRAAFLAAAVLGVVFANVLAVYSLAAAFAMAIPIAILLTFAAVQTSTIRRWRAEARELNRPRMTPDDYQRLREMEIELGWEPSEPPAPEAELPAESPQAACDCGKCEDAAREFDEQLREQIIASQGIPPAQVPERLTDSEVKDATEAAVHFAQLARVGRESCASPCRLCEVRDRHYPTPESRALLTAKLAAFKDDESLRQWIEAEQQGGTRSRAPMTGPGGRWRPVSELPEMQQATEGIPAGPLIENMRQELEAQREVTSPGPPAASYDFHFDSAGREWCRDTGMRCWIRPVPDGPWYRQNKSGGGER
jgi:hypothetical protein